MRRLFPLVLFGSGLLGSGFFIAAPAIAAPAPDAPADADRAAWRYRRAVTLVPDKQSAGRRPTFAALPLPPDLLSRGQPDQRDLRLIGGDGKEVPFLVEQLTGEAPKLVAGDTKSRIGAALRARGYLAGG